MAKKKTRLRKVTYRVDIFDADFLSIRLFDKLAYATCISTRRFLMRIILNIIKNTLRSGYRIFGAKRTNKRKCIVFQTELLSKK